MGDKKRFRRFSEFIGETFPHRVKVADVAGGHGELSFLLHELGKEATLIEPRERTFPPWIHKEVRRRIVNGQGAVKIERLPQTVEEVDLSRFDLVVAMHPDEATEPAIRSALAHGLDFAVVPCCPFPLVGKKRFGSEWIRHLAALSPDIKSVRLDISGPNTCLYRKTRDGARTELDEREALRAAMARLPRVRLADQGGPG